MNKKRKMPKEKSKPIEKKLKLIPTLREKRHYLVIKPKHEMQEKELKEKIDKAILEFLGIYGYAKAGVLFIEVKKNYGIISVTTKYVSLVKAALTFTDLKCIGVSGTIKKVRRFLK